MKSMSRSITRKFNLVILGLSLACVTMAYLIEVFKR